MKEPTAPKPQPCPPWCTRKHTGHPAVIKHHTVFTDLQIGDVTAVIELYVAERTDGRPTVGAGARLTLTGKGGQTQMGLNIGEVHMLSEVLGEALASDGVELLHRALAEATTALADTLDSERDGAER